MTSFSIALLMHRDIRPYIYFNTLPSLRRKYSHYRYIASTYNFSRDLRSKRELYIWTENDKIKRPADLPDPRASRFNRQVYYCPPSTFVFIFVFTFYSSVFGFYRCVSTLYSSILKRPFFPNKYLHSALLVEKFHSLLVQPTCPANTTTERSSWLHPLHKLEPQPQREANDPMAVRKGLSMQSLWVWNV